MADYLGSVSHNVPGLPNNWDAQAWTDEIVFFETEKQPPIAVAEFPGVPGWFVVEWAGSIESTLMTSVPISGPFPTLTAAIAAWKLIL